MLKYTDGFFLSQDIALPLLYSSVRFTQITALERFYKRLHAADQKWDSIRRIPYSSPGRWVRSIDVTKIPFEGQVLALQLDNLLTHIFPLTPLLATLVVNPSFVLSKRAISSLAHREGAINIRSLIGLSYLPSRTSVADHDPFVQLLRQCPNIEELAIVGQGLDSTDLEFDFSGIDLPSLIAFKLRPLSLPKLRFLSLLSMHSSPLMEALLISPLPALTKLEITPYDDVPYPAALSTEFIATHGRSLKSLLLHTPKSWPTRLHPSSDKLLAYCPNLNHLSCELPVPNLRVTETHELKILSIPRPSVDSWRMLENNLPLLPYLSVVRTRDVKWLTKGVTSVAQGTGVQGQMKDWKRRLERNNIQILDADWKTTE
jgi:hypothetical protein